MRRTLTALLWTIALGVLAQAVLAGLFLSVAAGARFPHLIVGSLLPFLALVVAVVGGAAWSRQAIPASVGLGTVTLPALLWIQSALGHMPFAVTTAVHVPLGSALLVHVVVLALRVSRHPAAGSTGSPAAPASVVTAGAGRPTGQRQ